VEDAGMVLDPKKVKEIELATTDEYNGQKVPCFLGQSDFLCGVRFDRSSAQVMSPAEMSRLVVK